MTWFPGFRCGQHPRINVLVLCKPTCSLLCPSLNLQVLNFLQHPLRLLIWTTLTGQLNNHQDLWLLLREIHEMSQYTVARRMWTASVSPQLTFRRMALAEGDSTRAHFSHPQFLTEKVIRKVTFEPIRKLQMASFCLMFKTLERIVHIYVSKCLWPQASHILHLTFSFSWKCAVAPHGCPRMLSFLGISLWEWAL